VNESVGFIVALVIAFGSAASAAIAAWKRAPTDNVVTLTERVETLEGRVDERDRVIDHLDRWQLAARTYIAQLRNTLADNGFEIPPPPADLEIAPRGDAR
jgi:hypothetical protein